MMITMNGVREPVCSCGEKAEVILYPHDLKVKCPFCGKEASIHYADGFYRLSVSDLACLVSIISNKTDE